MSVKVQTNVLCVKADGHWLFTEQQIAARLNYFHLLELSRINPMRFPWTFCEKRTPKQEAQVRAFLRERMRHLWDTDPSLAPIPGSTVRNPFDAHDSLQHEPHPETRRDTPVAPIAPITALAPNEPCPSKEDEQSQVVQAVPTADVFVIAPPGTGKTHVLVERIAHLITSGQCQNPSEEILVLSYTRSAVAEVRRRLLAKVQHGTHPDVLYARVLTFDSLATRALMLDHEPDFLVGRSYSDRVRLFADLIGDGLPTAKEGLSKVRFLLVDEVQDLSGHRANMVLRLATLVKQFGGAVCFLGDPAQAIYDFDEDAADVLTSTAFLTSIAAGSYEKEPPAKVHFSNYRRFETQEMLEFVTRARAAMGKDGLEPDGRELAGLLTQLGERLSFESLHEWAASTGTKAILARTNLEAYQIWEYCDRQEINAELWRGSSGGYWPGWIGRLALGYTQETMPLSRLEERWREDIAPLARTSVTDAIELLEREGVLSDGRLDLIRLNYLIAGGAPATVRRPASMVTISTIHRSKGLEFDEVLLYTPRENAAGEALEVRVLYVAATRARKHFRLLDRSQAVKRGARKSRNLWTTHFHVWQGSNRLGLLLDGIDEVDMEAWPSETAVEARECAAFIWQQGGAQIPRSVDIVDRPAAVPDLLLGGRRIGSVAADVHSDLQRIGRSQSGRFDSCSPVNMVDLATVALDLEDQRACDAFGVACLTLAPVISGITTVRTRTP